MTRSLLFLFLILGVGPAVRSRQQAVVPRFDDAACPVDVPKGENVRCGYLTVRENRSSKSTRTIRLPIIILKSDSPDPKPDPVLRTLGGPGASSLRTLRGRR